ncbi:choice-of-anchor L domain-containing protein [Flavobacterium sp. SUN046]|uniref:DUF7619 domain-containing protein n=1 Tax=Flavobacterium sp. SUN046 TaxID=3002440 RepID=UPI002DBE4012|nr:choice-of-anchor L domain-containing protein [Flavobacterium sp. SUN046]MEC4049149.1 choice-of-anchor L domain-containing protein [Flavobacterium sp. SUN046]
MKKLLLLAVFTVFFTSIFSGSAQTLSCGDLFTDPQGPNLDYAINQNVTTTICPSTSGEMASVTFQTFSLENTFDTLKVYNGASASAPLIATLTGSAIPGAISSSDPSGCLTFVFTSDSSITSQGWTATVTCATPSNCLTPSTLTASSTYNSITLGWTELGSASNWEVLVLPCDTIPTAASIGTITSTNPFVISNLEGATCYSVYVRSLCTDNNSNWSTGINITTPMAPPTCGGVFMDNGGASASYASNSDNTYIICPTNPGDVVSVNFSSFNVETNWDALYVFNGDSINATQIASTNSAGSVPGGLAGGYWGTTIPNFTSTSPDGCLTFRFRSDSSGVQAGWSATVTCSPPITCPAPTTIIVSSITQTSATVNWTSAGSETQWEVLLLTSNAPAPTNSSNGLTASTNPYTFNGLTAGTTYTIYVRAICSSTDASAWTNGYSFSTAYTTGIPLVGNTTQYSPEQLINNVLVNNPCISISNVTAVTGTNFGSTNGIGYFTNANPTFPLQSGIVLSTGDAQHISGPNTSVLQDGVSSWPGDPQLEAIIGSATGTVMNSFNATKLEFDFTSLNEFMSFNFLFASDEYGIFQCDYSDAFAFLLTDIETGITTNLAVVPGTTTPISVITIRDTAYNVQCGSVNPAFFGMNNQGSNMYSSASNFNGQTVAMTASSTILPNHPYHIKLVVADRGDSIYDSAVFIQAGSFTAGPPECNDKVQLIAFIDTNANGVKDNDEVNFTYGSFTSQMNNAGDITNISSPFGSYTIYDSNSSNTYDFNYQINPEYAAYYSLGTTNYDDINIGLNPNQILYFPITLTQSYNDVMVSIIPITPPVPGSTYINKIEYKNLGIGTASGTINFVKDPATTMSYISEVNITNNATGFSYDYTNLAPYETRFIYVMMAVPAIPTVAIGDVLTDSATITATTNDINTVNNSFTNAQIAVASYDPNEKSENHGGKILMSQYNQDDYLFYTIHFQNTGTTNAINIRLEDLLDSQLDPESIRMISASHNYIMERVNNSVIWNFSYIQLPSVLQSSDLSKGYVCFKIKAKPGISIGDIIPNTASIYFDSNPAIVTNTFNTEFVSLLNAANFELGSFTMSPNPASNFVIINLNNSKGSIAEVSLHDVLGKKIKEYKNISANQYSLDLSNLSKGVYMVEIKTEEGLKQTKKLIVK